MTAATIFGLLAASAVSSFCPHLRHGWTSKGYSGQQVAASATGCRSSATWKRQIHLGSSPNNDFDSDFPPPMDRDNSNDDGVDWDAEWKKVVANKDQPKKRPGQDFYKSEAEIVVTKTVNRSIESVQQNKWVSNAQANASNWLGDFRFWIAVMAVVSIATAVLNAGPPMLQMPAEQTYYI